MRLALVLVLWSHAAAADDFLGPDSLGTAGLGVAIDHDPPTGLAANYDYSLRIGKTFRATDRLRPGGFFELHSLDFEAFDAALGPQLQLRLGDQLALQARGGLGIGTDGMHALAGMQLGTYYFGASITARRVFDTHDTIVSLNIEFIALLPAALAIALATD